MLSLIKQQHMSVHKLTWTIVIKGTRHGRVVPAGGGGTCTGTVGAVPWGSSTPAGQSVLCLRNNCQKPPQGVQQNLHDTMCLEPSEASTAATQFASTT